MVAVLRYDSEGSPVIIADMGAGAGQITADWFDGMFQSVAEAGVAFTAIGVITSDTASKPQVPASKLQTVNCEVETRHALFLHHYPWCYKNQEFTGVAVYCNRHATKYRCFAIACQDAC